MMGISSHSMNRCLFKRVSHMPGAAWGRLRAACSVPFRGLAHSLSSWGNQRGYLYVLATYHGISYLLRRERVIRDPSPRVKRGYSCFRYPIHAGHTACFCFAYSGVSKGSNADGIFFNRQFPEPDNPHSAEQMARAHSFKSPAQSPPPHTECRQKREVGIRAIRKMTYSCEREPHMERQGPHVCGKKKKTASAATANAVSNAYSDK